VLGSQGQENTEAGAFAEFAFDFDPALMSLDDHAGLKHTDPEPIPFCRLKGAEEGVLDKIGAHSATVVDDLQYGPTIATAGYDLYPASRGGGVASV